MADTPTEETARSSNRFQLRWVRRLPFIPMYSDPWPKRRRKYFLSFLVIGPLLVLLGWFLGVRYGFGGGSTAHSPDQTTSRAAPTAHVMPRSDDPKMAEGSPSLSITTSAALAPSAVAAPDESGTFPHPRAEPKPAKQSALHEHGAAAREPEGSLPPLPSPPTQSNRQSTPSGADKLLHSLEF